MHTLASRSITIADPPIPIQKHALLVSQLGVTGASLDGRPQLNPNE